MSWKINPGVRMLNRKSLRYSLIAICFFVVIACLLSFNFEPSVGSLRELTLFTLPEDAYKSNYVREDLGTMDTKFQVTLRGKNPNFGKRFCDWNRNSKINFETSLDLTIVCRLSNKDPTKSFETAIVTNDSVTIFIRSHH
jgi:hypothetical protein